MKALILLMAVVCVGCGGDPGKKLIKVKIGSKIESWGTVGDHDWEKDKMGRWCYRESKSKEGSGMGGIADELRAMGIEPRVVGAPPPTFAYPAEKEGVEAVEAYMKSKKR